MTPAPNAAAMGSTMGNGKLANVATVRDTKQAQSIARRHNVTVEQVQVMAQAVMPYELNSRAALWNLALKSAEFQAEALPCWAAILSDLTGKSERRLYEMAKAGMLFGDVPLPERMRYGFSCWVLFAAYAHHENAEEVWSMWSAEAIRAGHEPKVERLREMLYEMFGANPTQGSIKRRIGRVERELSAVLVDTNGNLSEWQRLSIRVALRAARRAVA